jgi:hypothetical protein
MTNKIVLVLAVTISLSAATNTPALAFRGSGGGFRGGFGHFNGGFRGDFGRFRDPGLRDFGGGFGIYGYQPRWSGCGSYYFTYYPCY